MQQRIFAIALVFFWTQSIYSAANNKNVSSGNSQTQFSSFIIYPEKPNMNDWALTNIAEIRDSIKTICLGPVKIDPSDTTTYFLLNCGNTNRSRHFEYQLTEPSIVESDLKSFISKNLSCKLIDRSNLSTILSEKELDLRGLTSSQYSEFKRLYNVDCLVLFTLHYSRFYHVIQFLDSSHTTWRKFFIPELKLSVELVSTKSAQILWSRTSYFRSTNCISSPATNEMPNVPPEHLLEIATNQCLWPFFSQEWQFNYVRGIRLMFDAHSSQDTISILKELISAYPEYMLPMINLAWKYFQIRDTSNFVKYARRCFERDKSYNDDAILINYGHIFVFHNAPDSALFFYRSAISRYKLSAVTGIKQDFKEFIQTYPSYLGLITRISNSLFDE